MPIFRLLDLEWMLIYQANFFWKSAILQSIKLPFDVQAAEKILHVIYYALIVYHAYFSGIVYFVHYLTNFLVILKSINNYERK